MSPDSLLVSDDRICENQNKENRSFVFSYRHLNQKGVCYLALKFSRVPKQLIRDNSYLIILFKHDETNIKYAYNNRFSSDMPYVDF